MDEKYAMSLFKLQIMLVLLNTSTFPCFSVAFTGCGSAFYRREDELKEQPVEFATDLRDTDRT